MITESLSLESFLAITQICISIHRISMIKHYDNVSNLCMAKKQNKKEDETQEIFTYTFHMILKCEFPRWNPKERL